MNQNQRQIHTIGMVMSEQSKRQSYMNRRSQRNTKTSQRLIVKDHKIIMLKLQLNPIDLVGTINS